MSGASPAAPDDLEPGPVATAVSLMALGALAGWFCNGLLLPPVGPSGPSIPAVAPVGEGDAVTIPQVPTVAAGPAQPDIFLVTVGSLRADHLTLYGYERQTAPWIAEVGQRSHVFLAASATSSWSLPSIASLMTGAMPSQHGLVDTGEVTRAGVDVRSLSPGNVTLAERLKAAGYNTFAVVGSPLLLPESGLERGFDRYLAAGFADAPALQFAIERIAPEVRNSQAPVFVWVHYTDPRDPYKGNPMLLRNWEPGRPIDEKMAALSRLGVPDLLCRKEFAAPGPELFHLQALYDSEIRTVDQHVQLLYGDLGITDEDVVVITADHGEGFRDHGELGHRRDLYEESVRVPLVMSWPSTWIDVRRFRNRVSLIDLVPTFAEIAGAPIPETELPARSLLPLLDGREWQRSVPVGAELLRADGERHRAVYDLGHKLVMRNGVPELYSLRDDPGETVNLAADKAKVVQQLQAHLELTLGGVAPIPAVRRRAEVAPAIADQLRSLGYSAPRCR